MRRRLIGITCVAAVTTGGCAALPVAALGVAGNVADIGNAAFTAGTEVFNNGKMESVEFATLDQAVAAVRWTLNDLRLRLDDSHTEKTSARFEIEDDSGSKLDIDLKRRTAAICQMRIDVGWFGSEAYARLLLKSVRGRLPAVTPRATTRPAAPVDLTRPRYLPGFQQDNLDRD